MKLPGSISFETYNVMISWSHDQYSPCETFKGLSVCLTIAQHKGPQSYVHINVPVQGLCVFIDKCHTIFGTVQMPIMISFINVHSNRT